ncbi:hypothetical protein LTR17_006104 [Elasticomyces elasticus]|nr:hypothetical protein LTR17_006104 [Elasticomyces elasticus]
MAGGTATSGASSVRWLIASTATTCHKTFFSACVTLTNFTSALELERLIAKLLSAKGHKIGDELAYLMANLANKDCHKAMKLMAENIEISVSTQRLRCAGQIFSRIINQMATRRPVWATEVIDADPAEKPERGQLLFAGSTVDRVTDGSGQQHTTQMATKVYAALDHNSLWMCLAFGRYGWLKDGRWEGELSYKHKWYTWDEFILKWPNIQVKGNLLPVLPNGDLHITPEELSGTINEAEVRKACSADTGSGQAR